MRLIIVAACIREFFDGRPVKYTTKYHYLSSVSAF